MFTSVFSGHLTADANFKAFEDKGVINFTVAVNFRTGKKDENGNFVEEAEFFQCSKWVGSAEQPAILEHLKKGKKVIVECKRIMATTFSKDGKDYVNMNAIVDNLELC